MIRIEKSDGSIEIDAKQVTIPSYRVTSHIGSGANGHVFLAEDEYLQRQAAVKLWMKLRSRDRRDKFKQGVFEAKKATDAVSALGLRYTPQIYNAGEVDGMFYCAMEYFPSITLADWLKRERPSLGRRWRLAKSIYEMASKELPDSSYHGDLHTKNILISTAFVESCHTDFTTYRYKTPDFRLVDYGTSAFTRIGLSHDRHWKVLAQTLSELLWPFRMSDWVDAPWTLPSELIGTNSFMIFLSRVYFAVCTLRPDGDTWKYLKRHQLLPHLDDLLQGLLDDGTLEPECYGKEREWQKGRKMDALRVVKDPYFKIQSLR